MNSRFERTIDIKKLCISVFEHWRCILICMLAGMIALIFLVGFRTGKGEEEKSIDITVEMDELDEESQANIQNVLAYKKVLEEKQNYYDNSVLMKLNANELNKGKLTLYIKSGAAGQANLIAETIGILLSDGSGISDISLQLNGFSVAQLKEVIEIKVIEQEAGGENEEKGALIDILVMGNDSDICSEMLNKIDEYIDSKKEDIGNRFGNFEIIELDRNIYVDLDKDIQTLQNREYNDIVSLETEVKNRVNALSKDELSCYNSINGIEEETKDEIEDNNQSQKIGVGKYVKYAILGCFLGSFVCMFILGIQYIFNGYLKKDDDLEEIFNIWKIQDLQKTSSGNKTFFIDKWINDKKGKQNMEAGEGIATAELKLQGTLSRRKISKILICGEGITDNEMEIIEELAENLRKQEIETYITNRLLEDAYQIEKNTGISDAIIVGEIGKTSYETFLKEIRILEKQEISIVGALTV